MYSPLPSIESMTPNLFLETFYRILEIKERVGIKALLDNPRDLLKRAELYGTRFSNGSWGWASNVWSRSATNTVVIEDDSELRYEHKLLMARVLEHILAQGPLIKVDRYVGNRN